jgi:hypothetical protein
MRRVTWSRFSAVLIAVLVSMFLSTGSSAQTIPVITSVSPSNAAPNIATTVILIGSGFGAVSSPITVSTGLNGAGSSCTSPSWRSSTTVTCTIPPTSSGPLTFIVTVGTSTSIPGGRLTIAEPPVGPPTVSAVTPNSGLVDGGTSVTITGTDFTATTRVTFGGVAATGVTVTSATSLTAVSPAGPAGSASVLVTNVAGTNAANTLFTYGVVRPSVAITGVPSTIASTAPFSATFTFSEDVTGFDLTDISGAISNATASGFVTLTPNRVFAATITPTVGASVTVGVNANAALDADNFGNNATTKTAVFFVPPPPPQGLTTTITTGGVTSFDQIAPGSFVATVSFSQAVVRFRSSNLTATNASVSGFLTGGSGSSIYTMTVTPLGTGDVSLNVAQFLVQSPITFEINQAAPTVTVTQFTAPADTETPVIAAVTNKNVNTDAGLNTALIAFATTVSDNVDVASHFTPVFKIGATTISSPYDFAFGVTTVSVTANADTATNVADAISFTVTVTDDGMPVFAGVPVDITQNTDAGGSTAVVNFTAPTVEDAVDGTLTPALVSLPTAGLDSGSAFPLGITTLTYTATDAALNVQTASFTITISDAETPVIAAVTNKNVNTDAGLNTASVAFATTVSDNADAASHFTPIFKIGATAISSPYDFAFGVTTVSVTANADTATNVADAISFTVTVTDDGAPVFAGVPVDITQNTDAGVNTAVVAFTTPTAVDAADGAITPVLVSSPTVGLTSGDAFPVGVTTMTYNATDAAGNAPNASFTITITDAEIPVIAPIESIAVMTAPMSDLSADVIFAATVSDNVDTPDSFVPVFAADNVVITSPHRFGVGVTTVTVTANEDSAKNSADPVSFTVTVTDDEAPVIAAPADITVETDAGVATALLDVTTIGAVTDAVDAELLITYQVGETVLSGPYDFALGETMVTMDATDSAGNVADQASFKVTVFDDTPPAVPAGITVVVNIDGSVTVSGTAEDGSTVEVTFPDGDVLRQYIGILTANARGKVKTSAFAITSNGKQPAGMTTVVVIDPAGNRSATTSMMMTPTASVAEIQENILGYMQARATHVVRAQPDLIGMLSGARSGGLNAQVTKDAGSFDFKSSAEWPVWAQLEGSWSKGDGAENSYFMGAFGGHYAINPNAIIGAMVAFDQLTQTNGDTTTEGTGYLVGPYFVAKLPDQPLFLEARYLIGKSTNTVSVDGTLPETFETDRTLASVKVAGQVQYGKTTFTPSLTATHLSDIQAAFIDDVNRQIGAQTVTVNDVAFGLDFATPVSLASDEMTVTGGLSGIWSETTSTGATPASDGVRMRVHTGVSHAMDNGVTLSAAGFYDGIGADDYEGWGVSVGLEMTF